MKIMTIQESIALAARNMSTDALIEATVAQQADKSEGSGIAFRVYTAELEARIPPDEYPYLVGSRLVGGGSLDLTVTL